MIICLTGLIGTWRAFNILKATLNQEVPKSSQLLATLTQIHLQFEIAQQSIKRSAEFVSCINYSFVPTLEVQNST